jgi:hypothetical protein
MWVRILQKTDYKTRLIPEILTGYRIRTNSLTMNYGSFLLNAKRVMKIFGENIPQFDETLRNRAFAEVCRITSRKALSAGQIDVARRLMQDSVQHCPSIVFTDLRAFATFLVIGIGGLLPKRWQSLPYRFLEKVMKFVFRYYVGRIGIEQK